MKLPIYQVDAFADRVFAGNPAAVCPLDEWLSDETLQAIAAENNLSETAYFVRREDGVELRWFTPKVEVELCGHATLASAFVLYRRLGHDGPEVRFHTRRAGTLVVRPAPGDVFVLDLPARPPAPLDPPRALVAALGAEPSAVLAARDYLAVYDDPRTVRQLRPDLAAVAALDRFAVIVTAPGDDGADFVSRFFAPAKGVPEDPVTGSAHCTLTPYWSARLGKPKLRARQVSARGGELECELDGDRVRLAGRAVLYLEGEISIP